jgi:hypothetical protein
MCWPVEYAYSAWPRLANVADSRDASSATYIPYPVSSAGNLLQRYVGNVPTVLCSYLG